MNPPNYISDQEFLPFLQSLGVESDKSFEWMFNDPELSGVLQWLYNSLDHSNTLSAREKSRFAEIEPHILSSVDLDNYIVALQEEYTGLCLPGDQEALQDAKMDVQMQSERLKMLEKQEGVIRDLVKHNELAKEELSREIITLNSGQRLLAEDEETSTEECLTLATELDSLTEGVVDVISNGLSMYSDAHADKAIAKKFLSFGPFESYKQTQDRFKSQFDLYVSRKFNKQSNAVTDGDQRRALVEANVMGDRLTKAAFTYIEAKTELAGEQAKLDLVTSYQSAHPSKVPDLSLDEQAAIEKPILDLQIQDAVKDFVETRTRLATEATAQSALAVREYVIAEEDLKKAQNKVIKVRHQIQAKNDEIMHNKETSKNLEKQMSKVQKKLEHQTGNILKDLEKELTGLEMTEVKTLAAYKVAKDKVTTHAKRARLMEKALKDDENALNEEKKILNEAELSRVNREQLTQHHAELAAMQPSADASTSNHYWQFNKAEEAQKEALDEAKQEQEYAVLKLQVVELKKCVASSARQLAKSRAAGKRLAKSLQVAGGEYAAAENAVKEVAGRIKAMKAEIASRNTKISRLSQQRDKLDAKNNDINRKIMELEFKIKRLETEATECVEKITALEKENNWIPAEKQHFGAAGGLYDFQARQAHAAGARLTQLKDRKKQLARGLNARAHTLLQEEEEQYQDFLRKKAKVEAKRAKCLKFIAEFDKLKKRMLVNACEQVSIHFGSILSKLLPGVRVKLRPPKGLTVLDGVEINASFDKTYKESRGDDSVVALSLVLAISRLEPAPLYILDEVDAALQLSHTHHIV